MKKSDIHKQAVRYAINVKRFFLKLIFQIRSMTFAKYIVFWYSCITLFGAILLWTPAAQTGDVLSNGNIVKGNVSFVNALFTSASAFSDTGLSTDSAAISFSMFGQAVIACLIFVGGVGWFAMKVYIFNIVFGRPISFKSRENLNAERGTSKVGFSREITKISVTTLLIVTVLSTVVLSVYFYNTDVLGGQTLTSIQGANGKVTNVAFHSNPYKDPYVSLRWGAFHSISALNNAGFDIIGASSLEPYYFHPGVQIIFIILFVIGGVGYPVIYDVFMWSKTRFTSERLKFKFSLFTKLSAITYLLISIVGLAVVFGIEVKANDSFWGTSEYGPTKYKGMALFFNTMSTRNAGFSTIDMHDLSRATMVQYIVMMFIGSAPSSTAGGIRTTTFAVIILAIYSLLRGRSNVYAFKKQIDKATVNRAFVVFAFSVIIIIGGTLISITSLDTHGGNIPTLDSSWYQVNQNDLNEAFRLDANGNFVHANNTMIINGHSVKFDKSMIVGSYIPYSPLAARSYDFVEVMFEVSSAFGTTGLSAGVTPMLSVWSKMALILIMFIGQLGVSSSLLVWGKRKSKDKHFQRVSEEVSIG